MRKFLQAASRILAGTCVVLFGLTALLAILLVTLGSRLFNPNLYKHALLDQQAYTRLPEIIGEMLVTSANYDPCAQDPIRCETMPPELAACYLQELGAERFARLTSGEEEPLEEEHRLIQACYAEFGAPEETASPGGMPVYLRNMTAGDWATVIRRVLPPGEMQRMFEPLVDDIFAYLEGDAGRVTLSLVTLKQRLAGISGDEILRELITSQPDCTEVLLQLITGVLPMDELTLCNPPKLLLPLAIATTREILEDAVSTIPDEAVILPANGSGAYAGQGSGGDPGQGMRVARLVMFLSPLVPLVLLGLVTLFGVRSLQGLLRWWGIPFTLAGGTALVGSLKVLLLWRFAWDRWVMPHFPVYLGEGFAGLVRGLAGCLLRDLALWVGLGGLLLLLPGLAAWIGSRYIKAKP